MTGQHPTPAKIRAMRENIEALRRANTLFNDSLKNTNDLAVQDHFRPLVEQAGMVIAQERSGNTRFLANDLANLRSAVRRLPLEDFDQDLEMIRTSMMPVRGARGNLIEAIDDCLDTASAMGMVPSQSSGAALIIADAQIAENIIRLDERLRQVETDVRDLAKEVTLADSKSNKQRNSSIFAVHIDTLKTEISAARFETKIASDNSAATGIDLNVLTRSIEAISDVAGDLKTSAAAFVQWISVNVAKSSERVVNSAKRSYSGLKTIVRAAKRKLSRTSVSAEGDNSHEPQTTRPLEDFVLKVSTEIIQEVGESLGKTGAFIREARSGNSPSSEPQSDWPPEDFDLSKVHDLIRRGEEVPKGWRPFVLRLNLVNEKDFNDLKPIENLTALQSLNFSRTQVCDLKPIENLTALQSLDLMSTQVSDLKPIENLSALQRLNLMSTQVSDLKPIENLSALQRLNLMSTQVSKSQIAALKKILPKLEVLT